MPRRQDHDKVVFSILVYGCQNSGKRAFLEQVFESERFKCEKNEITIEGQETFYLEYVPASNPRYVFHILAVPEDVIEEEEDRDVFQNIDGIIFIWDSRKECFYDNARAFEAIVHRYENRLRLNIYIQGGESKIPIIVCLNKIDLDENILAPRHLIYTYLQEHRMPATCIFEINGSDGYNVLRAFIFLIRECVLVFYAFPEVFTTETPWEMLSAIPHENKQLKTELVRLKWQNSSLKTKLGVLEKEVAALSDTGYINMCCSSCGSYLFHPDFDDSVFYKCPDTRCGVMVHVQCIVQGLRGVAICNKCQKRLEKFVIPPPSVIKLYRARLQKKKQDAAAAALKASMVAPVASRNFAAAPRAVVASTTMPTPEQVRSRLTVRNRGNEPRFFIKIVLAGAGGIGKTTMARRFIDNRFVEDTPLTFGVQFHVKNCSFGGVDHTLTIWDLAGQERWSGFQRDYVKGANGALLVFDLSRMNTTFDLESRWLPLLRSEDPNLPIILVGLKLDLVDPNFPSTDPSFPRDFVAEHNLQGYIEGSCKTGQNVDAAFRMLVKAIFDHNNVPYDPALE